MDGLLQSRLRAMLGMHPDILAAWVHGSVASGTQRVDSNLDVAVIAERPLSLDMRLTLTAQLSAAVEREVDLVDLFEVHGTLLERVLTDGVLLFCRRRFPSRSSK